MPVWMLALPAFAERPYTSVGFAASDVVEFVDGASLRVHYATSGPSQTTLTDANADGVPDLAGNVLITADDSLALFGDLGLRSLVPEAELGVDGGGSEAPDVYMVDFQVGADGSWSNEVCDATQCVGYLAIDHRFANYGNPLIGVRTVVPHELFHGIQRAYAPEYPIWFSEGTATWSERQLVPDSFDFLGFSSAYLEDVARPIDRPPGGPVPAFAYGTALFFDHLTLRHDPELMTELLELVAVDLQADPDADLMPAIDAALQARGDDLRSAFLDFARYNLATGARAGGVPSYPYADRLVAPPSEVRAAFLDVDPRYFDYAMIFHRLDHPGGPAAIWAEADQPDVHLELFPTADAVIQPSIWAGSPSTALDELGDLPEGSYWLLGTVPERIPESIRVRICLGLTAQVEACPTPIDDTGGDTDLEPRACGCQGAPAPFALALLAGLVIRRRRTC